MEGTMTRMLTLVLAIGILLIPTSLLAQDHAHGAEPQGGSSMGMDGMMMGMQRSPSMILRMREQLGLTEVQVQRLEAVQQQMHQEHHGPMHAAMQERQHAQSLLQAETPDWGEHEARLRSASEHQVQAGLAMGRAAVAAREVLTGEQRTRLESAPMTGAMMQGGGMGGMDGNGGMMCGDHSHGQGQDAPSDHIH
jgi:Spy/CpxP family protein refolding chaperone